MQKLKPIGICDQCGGPIRMDWYTSKHQPRRYCSRLCRNTANSRQGAPIRSQKLKERVQAGIWFNPGARLTTDQRHIYACMGGAAAAAIFKSQVKDGTWRNPALSAGARRKLSRPRAKHNYLLHRAISKLSRGLKMADLTPDEAKLYRAYRHRQRKHCLNKKLVMKYLGGLRP